MGSFGDYVVIIKDPDEFQRCLVDAARGLGYDCQCRHIEYSDRFDTDRGIFDKAVDFAYQNEWRAVLNRGLEICEPYELYIGAISDIAEWCYTTDLKKTIELMNNSGAKSIEKKM